MVTLENYEEYIVLQVDGELDTAGQQELEAFMQLHPELREELALYDTVRLTPDTTQVFENKEILLRKEPGGRTRNFTGWFRYGAAAGLAALIALGVMQWKGDAGTNIAIVDTVEHVNTPIANDVTPEVPAPVKEEVKIAREETTQKKEEWVKQVVPQQKVMLAKVKEEKKAIQVAVPERLEIAAPEKLLADRSTPVQYETIEIPELAKEENTAPVQPEHETLAWLPISEERKEGLSMIGEAITARVDKVKEVRDNIKNTDLAVKVGKKELFTIRF